MVISIAPATPSIRICTPITVILVSTIGGILASGVVGLFVGTVVLAVGYKPLLAWLQGGVEPAKV